MKKNFTFIILGAALIIAGFVSWFASPHPDGLEKVAEDHGFIEKALAPFYSIFPDYSIPGLDGFWSNFFAGIIGTTVTFVFVYFILSLVIRKKKN